MADKVMSDIIETTQEPTGMRRPRGTEEWDRSSAGRAREATGQERRENRRGGHSRIQTLQSGNPWELGALGRRFLDTRVVVSLSYKLLRYKKCTHSRLSNV